MRTKFKSYCIWGLNSGLIWGMNSCPIMTEFRSYKVWIQVFWGLNRYLIWRQKYRLMWAEWRYYMRTYFMSHMRTEIRSYEDWIHIQLRLFILPMVMYHIVLYCKVQSIAQPNSFPAAEKRDWKANIVAANQKWNAAIFSQQKPGGWIKVFIVSCHQWP